ncbi:MAG: hypothetical protein ACR2QC_09810 [Gammaproteobacteria bacterium]
MRRRRFLPFAGMGRSLFLDFAGIKKEGGGKFAPSARTKRFRLSPEWRVLFVFADNTEFGGIRKYKKPPFPRKREICAYGGGYTAKFSNATRRY